MKKILTFAASALMLASCGTNAGYEINGVVTDEAKEGQYVYLYAFGEKAPVDSALVEMGKFHFAGEMEEAGLYSMKFSDKVQKREWTGPGLDTQFSTLLCLDKGDELTVLLDKVSTVKGSEENEARNLFQNKLRPVYESLEKIYSSEERPDDATMERAASLEESISTLAQDFITAHPDMMVSSYALHEFRYNLPEEVQMEIVDHASAEYKNYPWMKGLVKHLDVRKSVAVGKKFVDFEMADAEGQTRKLSEYVGNGKVTVIDFWASWCPPCRADMPNMVNIYKKYKSQGFEIVGISLDSKAEDWAKGVKDLHISWPQLSDLQGWKNAGAALYGVNSIPATVLVDKNGTIVAHNLHGEELSAKIDELLKK